MCQQWLLSIVTECCQSGQLNASLTTHQLNPFDESEKARIFHYVAMWLPYLPYHWCVWSVITEAEHCSWCLWCLVYNALFTRYQEAQSLYAGRWHIFISESNFWTSTQSSYSITKLIIMHGDFSLVTTVALLIQLQSAVTIASIGVTMSHNCSRMWLPNYHFPHCTCSVTIKILKILLQACSLMQKLCLLYIVRQLIFKQNFQSYITNDTKHYHKKSS